MFDLLLKGGRIYDGSGMPSFNADVAVAGGKIAAIGRLNGTAKRTLNVEGPGGDAWIHRSAHASRRAVALGSYRHLVVFSWRDIVGGGKLRSEPGAMQAGRPRRGDQKFCSGRGY